MSICEREKDFAILISIQFVLFIFDTWTFSFKDDSLLALKVGNKIQKSVIHVAIRRVLIYINNTHSGEPRSGAFSYGYVNVI